LKRREKVEREKGKEDRASKRWGLSQEKQKDCRCPRGKKKKGKERRC
jgi:hypothetical protein